MAFLVKKLPGAGHSYQLLDVDGAMRETTYDGDVFRLEPKADPWLEIVEISDDQAAAFLAQRDADRQFASDDGDPSPAEIPSGDPVENDGSLSGEVIPADLVLPEEPAPADPVADPATPPSDPAVADPAPAGDPASAAPSSPSNPPAPPLPPTPPPRPRRLRK